MNAPRQVLFYWHRQRNLQVQWITVVAHGRLQKAAGTSKQGLIMGPGVLVTACYQLQGLATQRNEYERWLSHKLPYL